MSRKKGLVLIGIDTDLVDRLLQRLEPGQQEKALRTALRATAKQARTRLAEKAQNTYTVKNVKFEKEMQIRAAKNAVSIRVSGSPLPLLDFKTTKRGGTVKAQVLKRGRLKPLVKGNIKAFVNNIASKNQIRKKDSKKGKAGSKVRHIAVAQRKGKKRVEINEKFSNSVPVMIGSMKQVYGVVEPEINSDLRENLYKSIDKALGRKI